MQKLSADRFCLVVNIFWSLTFFSLDNFSLTVKHLESIVYRLLASLVALPTQAVKLKRCIFQQNKTKGIMKVKALKIFIVTALF